jgi:hypothetical protein
MMMMTLRSICYGNASFLVVLQLLLLTGSTTMAFMGTPENYDSCQSPCIPGTESIMSPKAHGTSETPVQDDLRWNCPFDLADRICNYNRHYAENSGFFRSSSTFLQEETGESVTTFNDSNTGKSLFRAPQNRSWDDFILESTKHGWPSFRDAEVDWDNVRVLPNGETVSVDGTHLVRFVSHSRVEYHPMYSIIIVRL